MKWLVEPVDNGYVVRVYNNDEIRGSMPDQTYVATSLSGLFRAIKLAEVSSKVGTKTPAR